MKLRQIFRVGREPPGRRLGGTVTLPLAGEEQKPLRGVRGYLAGLATGVSLCLVPSSGQRRP